MSETKGGDNDQDDIQLKEMINNYFIQKIKHDISNLERKIDTAQRKVEIDIDELNTETSDNSKTVIESFKKSLELDTERLKSLQQELEQLKQDRKEFVLNKQVLLETNLRQLNKNKIEIEEQMADARAELFYIKKQMEDVRTEMNHINDVLQLLGN